MAHKLVVQSRRQRSDDPELVQVTERQFEVLRLLVNGCDTSDAIAYELKISRKTAMVHLMDLYEAFGVASRVGLIREVLQHPEGCGCDAVWCAALRQSRAK